MVSLKLAVVTALGSLKQMSMHPGVPKTLLSINENVKLRNTRSLIQHNIKFQTSITEASNVLLVDNLGAKHETALHVFRDV